jgi:hypothetical protein
MNLHAQTHINQNWNAVESRFDYDFTFVFNSREQYLEFRRQWKENYATLSRSLRELKRLTSTTMRQREYAGKLQAEVRALKAQATLQLLLLTAAKLEACRQYLAQKQPVK